ncbi:MAG: polysaccharide deacetylase [Marinilabiliales bacterium]|nr:MAG: polysaccharide deacetylase [Marinilabiliales bacterium]
MSINNYKTSAPLIILFSLAITASFSQNYHDNAPGVIPDFSWPEGIEMAISLTFDDARLSQADKGIPLLDKYDVKATFYVSPGAMMQRLDAWKQAARNGHEIGNHSLYHPCSGNFLWARDRALENYTQEQMRQELDSANRLIYELLGLQPVSFAYPCGQTFVGRGMNTRSYVPVVASMFRTGRGWLGEAPNDPSFCDMAQLTGMELDGKSFEQILILIENARNNGHWLILAGHETDNQGSQTSYLETIEAICRYASDPANGIWIDNVGNIATYITGQRGE